MYNAIELSKYIVTKCLNDQKPISNLQLQKILYYIQKEFLKSGEYAFYDDIEAWQFGPVVPVVYYHFCGYGSMSIDSIYDTDIKNTLVDKIVVEKRELNPWDMVNETHKEGGAWDTTYKNGQGNHCVITPSLIIELEG